MLKARLTVRGAHSRFEEDGSSAVEACLYEELAHVLAEDGFPPYYRVDTEQVSPQVAAVAIAERVRQLSSRQ